MEVRVINFINRSIAIDDIIELEVAIGGVRNGGGIKLEETDLAGEQSVLRPFVRVNFNCDESIVEPTNRVDVLGIKEVNIKSIVNANKVLTSSGVAGTKISVAVRVIRRKGFITKIVRDVTTDEGGREAKVVNKRIVAGRKNEAVIISTR
jgi:hypothetical protein